MTKKRDIEDLLDMVPFYVNGTLPSADKDNFEAALGNLPDLQAEVARENALQQRFRTTMDAELGPDHGPNLLTDKPQSTVKTRASESATAKPSAKPSSLASAMSFLNPLNWKPAVTLALAAAAVGQAAFIGNQANTISLQGGQIAALEKRNFELASGKGDCGGDAAIILEPDGAASWSDINKLLSDEGLSITGGGFGGPLMLRHDEDAALEDVLARLNASPLVSSAVKAS